MTVVLFRALPARLRFGLTRCASGVDALQADNRGKREPLLTSSALCLGRTFRSSQGDNALALGRPTRRHRANGSDVQLQVVDDAT